MSKTIPHIVVLGGGISGLSLAYFLQQGLADRANITVLESSARVGGWMETTIERDVIFEQGPRSCRLAAAENVIELAKALSIDDAIIFGNSGASSRYLWLDQQLSALPRSLSDLFLSSIGRKLLYGGIKDLITKSGTSNETVHDFFSRRFSVEMADIFADALVSGIYAGDAKQLSLQACFPKLFALEQEYGSVIRGALFSSFKNRRRRPPTKGKKSSLFSFAGGMQTLVNALAHTLQDNIITNHTVTSLTAKDNTWRISSDSTEITADYVFSCMPAHHLSRIIPWHRELALALNSIKTTSIAVVNCAFSSNVFSKRGFGYLIPQREKQTNLGVVWDSSVFSGLCPSNHSVLTVMIGGAHDRNFDQKNERDFIASAKTSLERQMGITENPYAINVKIARNAIPQYALDHGHTVNLIERHCQKMPAPFFALGNSFYGVSVNDCVTKSKEIATRFIANWKRS